MVILYYYISYLHWGDGFVAVYIYQNYLIIHFKYVQCVVYLSIAVYHTYAHLLVVRIAAVFQRYAFIWCDLALFFYLFGFGFCLYVCFLKSGHQCKY